MNGLVFPLEQFLFYFEHALSLIILVQQYR